LTPGIDMEKYAALPFASTLCGSCTAVCPVRIDLDAQLYQWRQILATAGAVDRAKAVLSRFGARLLARPAATRFAGGVARGALRVLPRWMVHRLGRPWTGEHAAPEPPVQSFAAWYRANRGGKPRGGSNVGT
jgi:L-lactate dehydrogenase complex protein LldF